MAAARKDLYLSVDGGVTSAFTAAMKAGRSTLADFGKSADLSQQAVRDAFAKLGGGDIANAAKEMEAEFNAAFASIRANARKVADAPTNIAAFDILSAQATREAVGNAELRVAALREVARAAQAAATGDASGGQRAYAVAAEAELAAEERVLAANRAKLDVLEAVEAQMRANGLTTREQAAAEEAAAMRRQAIAVEEAAEQAKLVDRNDALLRSIDPLYAAEMRFAEAMAEANALREAGVLTEERYTQAAEAAAAARDKVMGAADQEANASAQANVDRAEQLLRSVNPLYAAQKRYQETLVLTAELETAGALSAARAAEVRADAMAKLNAVNDAGVRAANAEQEAQAVREATFAYNMFEAKVREGAEAMREAEVEEQRIAQAANRIRAEVDPAWAAQARFDREMEIARKAVSTGALGLDEYCAKLRIERKALEEGDEALRRHSGGFGGMGIAGMEAEHVVRAFTDSIASGQPPLRALGMELPRVSEALMFYAQTTNATEGAMGKLAAFMGGGWGLAFAGAVAVAGPLVEKLLETNDELGDAIKKLNDDAASTRIADEAHKAFSRTIEGEIETQKKLNDQLDRQIMTQRQQQQFTLYSARQSVSNQQNSRPGLVQDIANQERTVADYQRRAASFKDDPQSFGATAAADRLKQETTKLEGMRDQLKRLDASIAQGQFAIREAEQPLLANDVASSMDAKAAATRRYEIAFGRLNFQLKLGAGNPGTFHQQQPDGSFKNVPTRGISKAEYTAELHKAMQVRDDALAAAKPGRNTDAADASLGDMTALLKQLFPGVRITSTTGGKHVAGSDHYTGHAIDFVPAGGMGSMSTAEVLEKLVGAGVHIRRNANGTEQFFGPGRGPTGPNDHSHDNHFHVAWSGRASPESADKRLLAAQRAGVRAEDTADNQDREFESQLAQANSRITRARLGLADTTENRLKVDLDELAFAKTARDKEIADALKAGKYGDPKSALAQSRAAQLTAANATGYTADVDLAKKKAADAVLDRQLGIMRDELTGQISILQLQSDLAHTNTERLALARQILDKQEQEARTTLTEQIAKEDDPDKKAALQLQLANVTPDFALRRQQADRQYADPVARYKLSLQDSVGDMNASLKGVEADGLKGLEDGLLGVIGGTKSAAAAFKQMAASIISDIARIAVEKLILSVVGLKNGGPVLKLAGGGPIFGEGGPRDDKVPALLSHGEYVINADAYSRHPALVQAINTGRLPKFADGGAVGPVFYPDLPSAASVARAAPPPQVIYVQVDKADLFDVHVQRAAAPLAQAAMIGGARQAQQDMAETSMARIPT